MPGFEGIYILCPSFYERLALVLCTLPVVLLLLAIPVIACVWTMLCLRISIPLLVGKPTMHVLQIVSAAHCRFSSGGS